MANFEERFAAVGRVIDGVIERSAHRVCYGRSWGRGPRGGGGAATLREYAGAVARGVRETAHERVVEPYRFATPRERRLVWLSGAAAAVLVLGAVMLVVQSGSGAGAEISEEDLVALDALRARIARDGSGGGGGGNVSPMPWMTGGR